MKKISFLSAFCFLLFINISAQQGGILGFEFEDVDRVYNSESNKENIYLFNYSGRPLKALQFKILIKTGLEFISDISLSNGADIPPSKFLFDYQIHNKTDENGNSLLEISALILGINFYELTASKKYQLAELNYTINQSQLINGSIAVKLKDVTGATSSPVIDANIAAGNDLTIHLHPEIKDYTTPILNQNYPNPFNPTTTISWQSPVSGFQKIVVYDLLGNEISTLINDYLEEGIYTIDFKDESLSSGIYFYQLIISYIKDGNERIFSETKRMIFLK